MERKAEDDYPGRRSDQAREKAPTQVDALQGPSTDHYPDGTTRSPVAQPQIAQPSLQTGGGLTRSSRQTVGSEQAGGTAALAISLPEPPDPLSPFEEFLRKFISWLRWPPFVILGGATSLAVALVGHPDNALLFILVAGVLVLSQIGGVADSVPRASRWIVDAYERLAQTLSRLYKPLKTALARIERICRDRWD